jgi:hypothetical protein
MDGAERSNRVLQKMYVMKCLNKSLPLVQDLLKVIPNEGAVAILFDRLGENATYEQIVAENQRLTREAPIKRISPVDEVFSSKPDLKNDLEKRLKTFLSSINVETKVVDNLKERLQEKGMNSDAVAVSDILHKAVFLDSEKYNTIDFAEEVATFAIEFMGASNHPEASPLIKSALNNITSWEKYNGYYEKYKNDPIYANNERKIKVEILSKLLAEKILENKDKTKRAKVDKKLSALEEIINKVLSLFDKLWKSDYYRAIDRFLKQKGIQTKGVSRVNIKPFDAVINEIVDDILFNDVSKIINEYTRGRKGNVVVSLNEVLESSPEIKEIYHKLNSLGFMFTGSPALSMEGTVYRESNENIHDLDWQVPIELQDNWLDLIKQTFPEVTYKINASTNQAQIFTKGGKTTHSFVIKGMPVDFFVVVNPTSERNAFGDMRWQDTFEAKMDMGRNKDIRDLIDFKTSFNDYFSNRKYVYYSLKEPVASPTFQLEEVPASTASPETIGKVKKLLEKMGVSVKDLATYVKEAGLTNVKGVNGVADLTRRIIAIAEGKEDAAIVEEMVHIATAIIEQKNPNLVTEMISKIDRFKIYKMVFEQYKNNPAYQLPNGKPNIRKIKKEAVDKLIAEVIVNDNENIDQYPELREEENQSLVRRMWNAILDFFRKEYRKADISIFEEAAALITEGEIGTAAEIKEGGVYFQITDVQNKVQSKILETDNRIVKVEEKEKEADPLLMDTEEAKSFYKYKKPDGTWETIKKRVTDRVKEWYRERFGKKQFSKQEKAFNEIKRKFGVQGHADFQEIHSRYYHTEKDEKYGTRREKPLSRPTKFNLPSDDMYEKLEAYFVELMDTFPPGTMIFSEVLVYDPREKEAGTLDFLAVEPSGKGHILDWKFMHIKGDDVAWFKNGAFNIQLTRYREIARDTLGIKEFGMTRAIPIAMKFEPKNQKDVTQGYDLKGIAIGAVNPDLIKEIKLLPIASELESTGYDELDKLIRKLNKLLEQYSKEKVKDESAREFKLEKLNTLRLAIRRAQATQDVAPLLDVIELTMQEGQEILNDYNAIYKNAPSTTSDFKNKDLSAFSDRMNNFISTSEIFVNTARDLREIIYKEGSEEKAKTKEEKEDAAARKKLYNQLSKASDSIYYSQRNITDAALNFADKHIGEKYLVFGLLRPEPIIKSIASWFRGASEIGIKSIELLSKLTADAQSRGAADAFEEIKDLMSIRERFAKRGNIRELARKVYQVNEKGERVNKLVFKYKKDFNDILDKMADGGGDMNWIKENIDVEEYKKEAEKEIERRAKYIEEHRYSPDDAENEDIKRRELDRINRMFNLEHKKFDGWNNYILKRHGLSKWYSDQYKEVEKDPDLFALYSFIQKFNEKAKDVGYIENNITKNFIPFIRKGMAEELAWDGSISAVARWNQSLKLNPDDVGYGEFNEITGELENSIPRYYTYDFTYKDGVNDYSDVSEDIFKNMILYIQQVEKYKYLVDIEGMLKLLKTVEQFKANIRTDRINNVVRKDGKVSEIENNFDNAKMYDDFMRVMLYEQKYVLSDKDVPLYGGKVINYFKDAVNTITGREVWKKDETPSATSLHKTMDAANKALQLKSLGLDFIPGAINWFGGNLQMLAQVGTYFNVKDFTKNESYLTKQLVKERFVSDEEKETFIQLLNTFMPLKDDPSYDLYKSAGMSALTRGNLSDNLFVFMREPEILLEKTVFLSLLDNTMVEDGKVVNIQEFVKKKYKNRYDSSAKYKEAAPKIEQEIAELKKTRSISAIKKLENGKLVIPGLDLTNRDELQRLTNLSRDISSKITGSMTRQQVNRASQSIWMKSMMVFRGWIPKLADTRFGEFRRISDDFSVRLNEEGLVEGQKYDIGRIRLLLYVLNDGFYKGFANINNILAVNDAGLERLDEMFEDFRQKFEDETGEVLNMTREDFIDLIRTNLRNEIRELLILGILLGSMLSLGFIAPDDDDDKAAKNKHRYAERVVGRFVDELSFFYNPSQWSETLAGGIFPATGLISDFTRFLRHFTMEITGIDFDPKTSYEDVHKKAQPVKHLMKMFPVTKSAVTYLGIFSDEFAREFDVTIQKETNR